MNRKWISKEELRGKFSATTNYNEKRELRTSPKAIEALKANESSVVMNGQRYEIEEPSRQRRRAIQRERLKAFNRHKKLKLK